MTVAPLSLCLLLAGCASRPLSDGSDGGGGGSIDLALHDGSGGGSVDLASNFGVPCGRSVCDFNATGEFCCLGMRTCSSVCLPSDEALACDGPEDCPAGQKCCYASLPEGSASGCQTSCNSTSTSPQFTLCHSNEDCAPSESCCPPFGGGRITYCRAGLTC